MDDNDEKKIMDKWQELQRAVNFVELDVAKNSRGTAAAGVRARKGLRAVKAVVVELIKLTVETDKSRKAANLLENPKVPGAPGRQFGKKVAKKQPLALTRNIIEEAPALTGAFFFKEPI